MRHLISTIALSTVLVSGQARAFDAAGADIIGLRLGMPEPEIVARLAHQGYKVTGTPEALTSRTLDGQLLIATSTEHGATEIRYVFDFGGKLVSAKLRDSIVTHFGDPVRADPMTWCRAAERDGSCPADQATLTFLPEKLTLVLRAGSEGR